MIGLDTIKRRNKKMLPYVLFIIEVTSHNGHDD